MNPPRRSSLILRALAGLTTLLLAMTIAGCSDDAVDEGANNAPNNAVNNDAPNNDAPNNDAPNNDAPNNDVNNDFPNNDGNNDVNNDTNNDTLDAGEDASAQDAEQDTAPDATPDAEQDTAPDVDDPQDATPDAPTPEVDPAAPGDFTGRTVTETLTRERRRIPVVAHIPEGLVDPAPAVVLLPGFQMESRRYLGLVEHLVSHGFVVVRADPPADLFTISHVAMAADIEVVLDWVVAPDGPLAGLVDPARLGMTGHSLGGKVSVMAAFNDPRVKAVLGIDPVNIGNPFTGFSPELPDILPAQLQDMTIPYGFVGETVSATSNFGPACAPAEANFTTFFQAATSSPWVASWDFVGADHMDFVFDKSACLTCESCNPAGTADEGRTRAGLKTLAAAFFMRHFMGDPTMDAWLLGERLPEGVEVQSR